MPIQSLYDEKNLLAQVATGDEKAFRRLFNQYWDNIYSVAFVFTKSTVLAEEIVQDVFMKLWQKKEQLPGIENFEGWLFTIARNHILNELRKKITVQSFREDLEQYFLETSSQPDEALLLKESEQLISKAVDQLHPQQKKIFIMMRREGLSQKEIADKLNLSRLTVKTHMHLAIKSIRQYLQKHSSGALFILCILDIYLPLPL